MLTIDGIKVDGKSNAFFDEVKLNHAAASEKAGEIACADEMGPHP